MVDRNEFLPARVVPVRAAAGAADGARLQAVRHRVHADRRLGGRLRPDAGATGAPRLIAAQRLRSALPGRVARACAIPTGCTSRSWRTTRSRAPDSTRPIGCPVALRSVTLSVPDLARSEAFFSRELGLGRSDARAAERPSTRRCGGWPARGRAAACSPPAAFSSSSCSISIRSGGPRPAGLPDLGSGHPQHRLRRPLQARPRRALPPRTRGRGAAEPPAAPHAGRGRHLRQRPAAVLGRAAVDVPGLRSSASASRRDRPPSGRRPTPARSSGRCASPRPRRPRGMRSRTTRSMAEWIGLGSVQPDRRRRPGSGRSRVRTAAEASRREHHRTGAGLRAADLLPLPRDEGIPVRLPPGRDPAASSRRSDRAHLEHPLPAEVARNRPPAGDHALLAARTRAALRPQAARRSARPGPSASLIGSIARSESRRCRLSCPVCCDRAPLPGSGCSRSDGTGRSRPG